MLYGRFFQNIIAYLSHHATYCRQGNLNKFRTLGLIGWIGCHIQGREGRKKNWGIGVLHSEGRYITDIRIRKITNK